jgi:hypothetical protein
MHPYPSIVHIMHGKNAPQHERTLTEMVTAAPSLAPHAAQLLYLVRFPMLLVRLVVVGVNSPRK